MLYNGTQDTFPILLHQLYYIIPSAPYLCTLARTTTMTRLQPCPCIDRLPAYIIVDMDDYSGQIWDQHNPSHVPIPITDTYCNKPYSCCKMRTIPIEIAYARTLYKF